MTEHRRELKRKWIAGTWSVVAAVNYFDDEIFDWAAYLGAGEDEEVASEGEKVEQKVACTLFPDLPADRYRT